MAHLILDGSQGEGGGQILRSALALSVITGQAFEMVKIRANRSKPGLRTQHLTCVQAAQVISAAEVQGAEISAQNLHFAPQTLVGGHYHFAQPGAGSTMLVLQTLLLPLLLAAEPSSLSLTGGTHNPMAPPFDFIAESYLPCLRQMGAEVEIRLERAGFFPAGGGHCRVKIQPVGQLKPLYLGPELGPQQHRARILLSQLPDKIAEREAAALAGTPWQNPAIERVASQGPGNLVLLSSQAEGITSLHAGFGERRLTSERVVAEVLQRAQVHLASGLPVEEYLADQLLLPLALAGGGRFYTSVVSEHTRTHISTIQAFLDLPIAVRAYGKGWEIRVGS
ncbi:MAG: RNA 3'-terminal phosphate cyclase [Candidatus Sericytochromatia bacterium]